MLLSPEQVRGEAAGNHPTEGLDLTRNSGMERGLPDAPFVKMYQHLAPTVRQNQHNLARPEYHHASASSMLPTSNRQHATKSHVQMAWMAIAATDRNRALQLMVEGGWN